MATRFKKIFINSLLHGVTSRGVYPQSYKGHTEHALAEAILFLDRTPASVLWEIVTKDAGASEGAKVIRHATTLSLNDPITYREDSTKRRDLTVVFADRYVRATMWEDLHELDRELREWVATNKPSLSEAEAKLRDYLQKFELQGGIQ